ncbi:type II toxin-antitoxin system PemK/MazF family toxin [Clostridium aestuarii]|uniref:Type II toxin-antitoxin system PemK/MazF family toxin n=1 Tax=Clostridium aestuarii TaxID=338193 RepID=A0ABT4D177_9CLOT|nr:type II toxin-antitoxin system PemK/MazF family toxin [Clostridium aestuarii]MCY6484989.1 type II toxin-antitoxin system PemK/MazF family toxin [Clostridium aestuarii]
MKGKINNMTYKELEKYINNSKKDIQGLVEQYNNIIVEKLKENDETKEVQKKAYNIRRIYNYVTWVNDQMKMNNNVKSRTNIIPRRGEIWTCELGQNVGSEENKIRPVIVIQNDTGNRKSPTTIIAPISNRPKKIAVHIELRENDYKLEEGEVNQIKGTILGEQIKVVSKARLGRHIATVDDKFMKLLDNKLKISLKL